MVRLFPWRASTARASYRCVLGALLVVSVMTPAAALDVSFGAFQQWLSDNAAASSEGLPPGTYGQEQLEALAAYLPPGYREQFDFPGMTLELTATRDYPPHAVYLDATAKFGGQSRIEADGSLVGYTAGQPFSAEQIAAAEAGNAGYMVAWNQIHRWQNVGYRNEAIVSYIQPTADGSAGTLLEGMRGGGHVDRHVSMFYHRVYLSGLASRADSDYRMDVDGADTLLFKEYIEMLDPFDIAGLKLVVERPLDQSLGDQVNSYLPTERRVRRLSSKERADSWLGTNWTLDDFEGYSGLVMDNQWRLLGHQVLPHVASSRHTQAEFHGPTSTVPLDRWQLRRCFVVEAVPRWEGHPYGRRILFVDEQTYSVALVLVFDREDRLLKTFATVYEYSEDAAQSSLADSTPRWRASIAVNVQDGSANIARGSKPTEFVDVKPSQVRKIFSVSNLSSGR